MAVKASATVTLSSVVDVKSVWRYYKLQASTLSKPSKPTTNPPSGWTTTEPSYTNGSTNSLYFCDLTVFCDNSFSYSDVSLSSSYEAAKAAYNKAVAAKDAASNAQSTADSVKNDLANNYSTTEQIVNTYTTQTEFTQTSEEIRMDFTKSITSASNDLQSQIMANNTATNQKLSEINKYIRFVDGKIVLGETGSELTLTVQNDRVSFQQAGNEVAYFSNNSLYIRRAEVLTTLRIGSYEWAPRNDGGLALRKRGI